MSGDHGSLAAPGRRAGATGRGVLGSPRGQAFPLQTSLPGPTQIYLGFPQRGAQHKWQWRAGQVAAAHSQAWEAEPRALGALAVFERGLDAPAVGVRQMDPPPGERLYLGGVHRLWRGIVGLGRR